MKGSRIKIVLLTFFVGINAVSIFSFYTQKINEPFIQVAPVIEVPQVKSKTPFIIEVCPEPLTLEEQKRKQKNGGYARGADRINCAQDGGAS